MSLPLHAFLMILLPPLSMIAFVSVVKMIGRGSFESFCNAMMSSKVVPNNRFVP